MSLVYRSLSEMRKTPNPEVEAIVASTSTAAPAFRWKSLLKLGLACGIIYGAFYIAIPAVNVAHSPELVQQKVEQSEALPLKNATVALPAVVIVNREADNYQLKLKQDKAAEIIAFESETAQQKENSAAKQINALTMKENIAVEKKKITHKAREENVQLNTKPLLPALIPTADNVEKLNVKRLKVSKLKKLESSFYQALSLNNIADASQLLDDFGVLSTYESLHYKKLQSFLLMREKRWAEAAVILGQLTAINKNDNDSLFNLTVCLFNQHLYKQARIGLDELSMRGVYQEVVSKMLNDIAKRTSQQARGF
jgi:hypothetical protein